VRPPRRVLACSTVSAEDGDDELLARALAGDDEAWAELVGRLWAPVRRFFLNKVGDDADDLVQATFERLMEARARFEGRSTFRAFVFGIAHRVLLEHVRRKTRNAHAELHEVSVAAMSPGITSLLRHRADERVLLEALREITLDHQVVLELFYWEDMADSEISAVLEINVHTVRSRLKRARDSLRVVVARLENGRALPSTSADLDRWARGIRRELGRPSVPAT
jgi:RNA polymerase sigma factor (sigma-70 family)